MNTIRRIAIVGALSLVAGVSGCREESVPEAPRSLSANSVSSDGTNCAVLEWIPFVVTEPSGRSHTAKMKPTLVFSEPNDKKNVERSRKDFQDLVLSAVSVLSYEQLEGPNGRELLRREITRRVNERMKKLGLTGQVVEVQFYEPLVK